jgi:hypothetical protein
MVFVTHPGAFLRHGAVNTLALREELELPRHPWVGRLTHGMLCRGAHRMWTRPSGKGALTREGEYQLLAREPVRAQVVSGMAHACMAHGAGVGCLFSLLSSWDGQN